MTVRRAAFHVHVIPHLHWSSVPGTSEEDLRLRLVARLDRLLDRLADPNDLSLRSLLLDGQTSLIEDYLTLRPERYDQIEELVQDGKLALGPWYVQPDGAIAGVELLIRNLSLGLRTARTFGLALEVGYLHKGATPNPYLPQILRGFGLESALWFAENDDDSPIESNWQSPDGSQVAAVGLPEEVSADASVPLPDFAALRQQLASHT